ncbi:putative nucleic acid-binding protein [Medicago truncatula]|uniref:Putative nucleic acid-binding protein n=1 Tax=Medicago truncatula TaxID=3880 RepID=A0A396HEF9_MEDTR|nr:putative nucleic acid-binding protein [Medicago truncatula]
MCVNIYFILFYLSRYMIKVRVIDETDSATFVIFDRDATLLLKKTAADVIESMGSDESGTLPKEISSLVESTFLFKVETNISTDARFEKSYRVRRISNNVDLLKRFTGVPTEAPVVEGSFEAVENAENDSSVNQNLLKKFGDSKVIGTKDVDAEKAVDLTNDEVDVTPAKRSCPFDGEGSGGNGPVKLLKNIKVEKDKKFCFSFCFHGLVVLNFVSEPFSFFLMHCFLLFRHAPDCKTFG